MTVQRQTMVPRRADGEPLRLAMQRIELAGRVAPLGARLWVRHRFRCDEKRPVEAVYTFALPRDGAVRRFRVEGDGFTARSRLEPVQRALEAYEDAVEEGHLAAVAESQRDGLVTLALGNLRPGEAVTVVLELVAGVDLEDQRVRFRFPFTLAPGYHRRMRAIRTSEGTGEIELPSDEFGDLVLPEWRADAAGLHRVGFALAVAMPVPVEEVASPSHPLRVRAGGDGPIRVELATEGDLPNRDLVLDVRLERPAEGVLWGTTPDEARHFAAVVPSGRFGGVERPRRRVVFVLDRSGSMHGAPMEAARRAVLACIGALEPEDEVGLIAFDDRVERVTRTMRRATDAARDHIRRAVEGIEARGGTELLAAVEAGAKLLDPEGGELVVITDGQVFGTEEVVAGVARLGVRVSCLGIGAASQDRFLAGLARATGGVSRFITAREAVDVEAVELFARAGRVTAVELAAELAGADGAALGPRPPAVVSEGVPVVVWGELPTGSGPATLRLAWSGGGGPSALDVPLEPPAGEAGATVALLRGARLASELEAATPAVDGEAQEQLEILGRRFGVANRAMALVAVHERADARPGELPTTRVVPVGLPEDVVVEAYFARQAPMVMEELPADTVACLGLEPQTHQRRPRRAHALGPAESAPVKPASAPPSPNEPEAPSGEGPDSMERAAVTLAGRLEADGGLPGQSLEDRIAATAAAAAALAWLVEREGSRRWRPHLERTLRFLRGADASQLDAGWALLLAELVEALEAGHVPEGPWTALAKLVVRARRPRGWRKKIWRALEEAFC